MKHLIILISFLFASSAFAATKKLSLDLFLSIDGKEIASPKLTVKSGERKTVKQSSKLNRSRFEAMAIKTNKNGIEGYDIQVKVVHKNEGGESTTSITKFFTEKNKFIELPLRNSKNKNLKLKVLAKDVIL